MLLVVFGAGASYDSLPSISPRSDPNHSDRPPLANDLFADRPAFRNAIHRFPACQAVVPYLQNLPTGKSLESQLENLQEEAVSDKHRLIQLAAVRYYLHYMLWECEQAWEPRGYGVTNYKTFLDQIRHCGGTNQDVCLVNFNYDRMVESALRSFGAKIDNMEDYLSNSVYPLVKLHGSVDWGREIDTVIPGTLNESPWRVAEAVIAKADNLSIGSRYHIVTERPTASVNQIPLYPALAIPVQSKQRYECPEKHVDFLKAKLADVDKMIVIGWRANENHFLELLKSSITNQIQLLIVSGSNADGLETATHLQDLTSGEHTEIFDVGFTEFIRSRIGESFLMS